MEDPGKVGGVIDDREFEAEVGEMAETLESAVEETEKVGGEDVVGPIEVESTDERGIKVVSDEGFEEAEGAFWVDVDERTVEQARSEVVKERASGEDRKEIISREVDKDELEGL